MRGKRSYCFHVLGDFQIKLIFIGFVSTEKERLDVCNGLAKEFNCIFMLDRNNNEI